MSSLARAKVNRSISSMKTRASSLIISSKSGTLISSVDINDLRRRIRNILTSSQIAGAAPFPWRRP